MKFKLIKQSDTVYFFHQVLRELIIVLFIHLSPCRQLRSVENEHCPLLVISTAGRNNKDVLDRLRFVQYDTVKNLFALSSLLFAPRLEMHDHCNDERQHTAKDISQCAVLHSAHHWGDEDI